MPTASWARSCRGPPGRARSSAPTPSSSRPAAPAGCTVTRPTLPSRPATEQRRPGEPARAWPTSSSCSSIRRRWPCPARRWSRRPCAARAPCCSTPAASASCSTCIRSPNSLPATSWPGRSPSRWRPRAVSPCCSTPRRSDAMRSRRDSRPSPPPAGRRATTGRCTPFPSPLLRTTGWAASRRTPGDAPRSPASTRSARWPARECTARTGWRRTRCSRRPSSPIGRCAIWGLLRSSPAVLESEELRVPTPPIRRPRRRVGPRLLAFRQ